jgi:hypothetical protein
VNSFAPFAGTPLMNCATFPIGLNFAIYIPFGHKKSHRCGWLVCFKNVVLL